MKLSIYIFMCCN